jgi:hypothetical protein
MKKALILVVSVLIVSTVKAQDLIVLKNAEEILAKVTAITTDDVTYKRWSNLEGPSYTTPKSAIFYIKYQNGEKDIFQKEDMANDVKASNVKNTITPIKFQGYFTLGTIFTSISAGPTVDLNLGVKIYEHFYLGVESGFHTMLTPINDNYLESLENWISEMYIPLGVNMKIFFTKNKTVNPYLNCSLGGFFGVGDALGGLNGFYCQAGAGFDVRRFTFGIGYSGLVKYGTASCGYIKLGLRLGK